LSKAIHHYKKKHDHFGKLSVTCKKCLSCVGSNLEIKVLR